MIENDQYQIEAARWKKFITYDFSDFDPASRPQPHFAQTFKSDATTQSLIGIWVKQTTVAYFCLLDIFWDLGERSGADRGGVEQRRSFILLKLTGAGGGPKLERALRELYNVHLRPLFHQNCPRSWSCH